MFEALRALQIAAWLAIVVSSGVLAHRLFAIDGAPIARRLRGLPRARIGEVLARLPSPFRELAEVAEEDDPAEARIVLRERGLWAERWCTRGLPWMRVLGLLASAVGFIAVAHQVSWLHADHGLLDLDPVRVGRMASERAAIALALAVAASGSAVALGSVVRERARLVLGAVVSIEDALERAIDRSP